jgi:hypothetical protein
MIDKFKKTPFEKFDLVAGVSLRLDSGEIISLIGIVGDCDNEKVSLFVVWSQYTKNSFDIQPTWFLGDEIEFNLKKSYCLNSTQFYKNIEPIGNLSFPYDLPGYSTFIFPTGDEKLQEAKKQGQIANRQQFKDLLEYVKSNNDNIGKSIVKFFNDNGWQNKDNTFLQGIHKDNREWNENNLKTQPLLFI